MYSENYISAYYCSGTSTDLEHFCFYTLTVSTRCLHTLIMTTLFHSLFHPFSGQFSCRTNTHSLSVIQSLSKTHAVILHCAIHRNNNIIPTIIIFNLANYILGTSYYSGTSEHQWIWTRIFS